MIVSRYFWAGVFVAFLGLIVNYVFLAAVFVEIQTIPLMIVTGAGIRFHHFMLSIAFLGIGAYLVYKDISPEIGSFLLGVGLILLADDWLDIYHWIKTGELRLRWI